MSKANRKFGSHVNTHETMKKDPAIVQIGISKRKEARKIKSVPVVEI